MNVVIINKSDSTGGAAVVSYRLMEALCREGIDTRMLVAEKLHDDSRVVYSASSTSLKYNFLKERLGIFAANGFDRSTLFKIDTGADGVPVWKHPLVADADVICLNWINQGMVSLKGVGKLCSLGKPVVWTMHDMWNMTGICHHAGTCQGFLKECGDCPLMGKKGSADDLSHKTWLRKRRLYTGPGRKIAFVAVSHWLAEKAAQSTLMRDCDLSVIPNAFPFDSGSRPAYEEGYRGERARILFGAARLDDPIKGFDILKQSLRLFATRYPDMANEVELVTFGNIKNPALLNDMPLPHRHLGLLDSHGVRKAYSESDIVMSTSLYETLPGTLVEGQAWGCVPVSLDRGGQRDIIDDGLTGFLASWPEDADAGVAASNIADRLAEAMKAIRNDGAALRIRMRTEAENRFGASSVARQYISLFRRLLS